VVIDEYLKNIRKHAQLVIQQLGPVSGVEFGFNKESVKWVEGYIERCRDRGVDEKDEEGLVNTLGSFLGECIVANTASEWRWFEQQQMIGVALAQGGGAFPFAKVRKQFRNGLKGGDAIYSFYDIVVNVQAKGLLERAKSLPSS